MPIVQCFHSILDDYSTDEALQRSNGGAWLCAGLSDAGLPLHRCWRYIGCVDLIDPSDLTALAALVQRMVEESGDPTGFDALSWTTQWVQEPLMALGGARPAEYMVTPEGKGLIETLVRRIQSGAYS